MASKAEKAAAKAAAAKEKTQQALSAHVETLIAAETVRPRAAEGPAMTVKDIASDDAMTVTVVWKEGEEEKSATFPAMDLVSSAEPLTPPADDAGADSQNGGAPANDEDEEEDEEEPRPEPYRPQRPPPLLRLIEEALAAGDISHNDKNALLNVHQRFTELLNNLRAVELRTAPDVAEILRRVEEAIG